MQESGAVIYIIMEQTKQAVIYVIIEQTKRFAGKFCEQCRTTGILSPSGWRSRVLFANLSSRDEPGETRRLSLREITLRHQPCGKLVGPAGKNADPAHFFAFSTESNFRKLVCFCVGLHFSRQRWDL